MSQSTITKSPNSSRLVGLVATVIGLSIMGDSLMYAILPLEAEALGFSLPMIGLLLSANRLIRLISNTSASTIFERLGPRGPFIGAAVLGFLTTIVYGLGWGFAFFLLARIGWGIAWSGLRQGGYEAVLKGNMQHKGRMMGVLWGIVRFGSAIGVVVGGYLRDQFGYPLGVGGIAIFGALAIPLALTIRWPGTDNLTEESDQADTDQRVKAAGFSLEGWRRAFQVPTRRWLLISGFTHALLEGVLIATASIFLADRLGAAELVSSLVGIGTIAGLLLAVRWMSNLIFGPLIGLLSDRIGQTQTALLLAGLMLAGFIGALNNQGLVVLVYLLPLFVASSGLFITLSAASSGLAAQARRPQLFVGTYTTITDAGSALGPLLAFNLGQISGYGPLYLIINGLLLLFVFRYWQVVRAHFRASPVSTDLL